MPALNRRALPHRARTVRTVRTGVRNAQGEYTTEVVRSEWFRARRATRRQTDSEPGDGGRRRSETRYILIFDRRDMAGNAVEVRASDRLEVDVRGTVEDWQVAGPPLAFDDGRRVFGGQAEIVQVGEGG